MIFDYMDILTKVGIANGMRIWCENPANISILIKTLEQFNMSEATLSSDQLVFKSLQLMAYGWLIVDIQQINKHQTAIKIMLRAGWVEPSWVKEEESQKRIRLHIEQILDAWNTTIHMGQPVFILPKAIKVFHSIRKVIAPPQPPSLDLAKAIQTVKHFKG